MTTNLHNKLNSRQYRFCLNILKGMSQTDAYLQAGYIAKHQDATSNASTLMTNPKVSHFLDAHQAKQLAEVEAQLLSKPEKRQILATFARAKLIDLIDENGQVKISKNSPAAKALKEWSRRERTDRNGNPIVTSSLKLVDPIAAIIEDNKMTGDYAPSKHLIGQKVQFEVIFVDKVKELEE